MKAAPGRARWVGGGGVSNVRARLHPRDRKAATSPDLYFIKNSLVLRSQFVLGGPRASTGGNHSLAKSSNVREAALQSIAEHVEQKLAVRAP